MRSYSIAFAMLITATAPGRAQDLRQAILRVDSAWARSYATNDTVLARSVFAEDIVITSTNGAVKTREDEIGDVQPTPGFTMEYFRTVNPLVRIYGKQTGIVTGVAEWKFENNGRPAEVRRRYTAVYVPGGPLGWKMVGLHIGRAPD
jgi:ketosteroid isomerase-like protein